MKSNKKIPLTQMLRKYKFLFDTLKSSSEGYVFLCDLSADIFFVSPNFSTDFNFSSEIMIGFVGHLAEIIHEDDRIFLNDLDNFLTAEETKNFTAEFRLLDKKKNFIAVKLQGKLAIHGQEKIFAGNIFPLTKINFADEVTNLPNDKKFLQAVKNELLYCRQKNNFGALFVFGLDNFKIVNEIHGRQVGNEILKRVADEVKKILPEKIYKLDGDKFGVIFKNADELTIEKIFIELQRTLLQNMTVDEKNFSFTISAGTVFYPQAGHDYLILQKYLDATFDSAKREGKNRNVIFNKEKYNRHVRAIYMREHLQTSTEGGFKDFELYFQPQVDARTKKLIGAEALLRWHNPRGKMVAPMEFIPLLEETRLILQVGRLVFEESIKQLKKWLAVQPNLKISVNLSHEQMKDFSFQEFVINCLERYEVSPSSVVLELTESKIVADFDFVNKQFENFRRAGIKIAMDDFGNGYSSLAALKNLNCDIIKIDRAFVKNILTSDFDLQLVKYIIELCHSIGMITCIEGVEEFAEYEILTEVCKADEIQGYLFGRPEPPKIFEEKFFNSSVELKNYSLN